VSNEKSPLVVPLIVIDLDVDDERQLAAAVSLNDDALGENFVQPDDLRTRRYLEIDAITIAALRGGRLVGTATACTMTPDERYGFDKVLWAAGSSRRLGNAPTGWIETLAIEESERGRGVGTALASEILRRFRLSGLRLALVESWIPKSHRGSRELFAKLGFEELVVIPDYYIALIDQDGVSCPYCGHLCRCAAAICVRDLTSP
jgi:GNAT superfamily N-acetyltransferase